MREKGEYIHPRKKNNRLCMLTRYVMNVSEKCCVLCVLCYFKQWVNSQLCAMDVGRTEHIVDYGVSFLFGCARIKSRLLTRSWICFRSPRIFSSPRLSTRPTRCLASSEMPRNALHWIHADFNNDVSRVVTHCH